MPSYQSGLYSCKKIVLHTLSGLSLSNLLLRTSQLIQWSSIKIFGEKRASKFFYGANLQAKHTKICHFYAEIVKFGQILIHLKLFERKTGDKIFFFWGGEGGGKCPMPLWHHHCTYFILSRVRHVHCS